MTTPPDPIEQAQALLDAATPGPWGWDHRDLNGGEFACDGVIEPRVECMAYCYGGTAVLEMSPADREFIAAAPSLVASLLQVIGERETALAGAQRERDAAEDALTNANEERGMAEAEAVRLQAEVDALRAVNGVEYCTVHDGIQIEGNSDDCDQADTNPDDECRMVALFHVAPSPDPNGGEQ